MCLDQVLPRYDFHETHSCWVAATPKQARQALDDLEGVEVRLLAPLMALRGLPARLMGRAPNPGTRKGLLEGMVQSGFRVYDEGAKGIVLGTVGKPWRLAPTPAPEATWDREGFLAFQEPGYCKIAFDFTFEPEAGGARIGTQTRVACTSRAAWLRLGFYWALIRLPSGLIRLSILAALERRLARGHGN